MDSYKPLSVIPSEDDLDLHKSLCNPGLVTERLGQLVPLLKFVGFKVEQMTPEKTVLSVPLLETAMNQNGTHQAAVFYLLADYTLGVGMFATLPGCYTVGVHDRCAALPVQFWLREGRVKHIQPGNGLIRGEVQIPAELAEQMRSGLIGKGRCELTHIVKIYQDDTLVAETEHTMGLYADIPRTEGKRASLTQVHNVKTSALMIAGLRDDDVSRRLAQDQGVAIARRMTRDSPQLAQMVSSRTAHVSRLIEQSADVPTQILSLGVGLDSKPVTKRKPNHTWYLCDLPPMLQERRRRLESAGYSDDHALQIGLDLRIEGWQDKILTSGFDPAKPTIAILEGVSMYLGRDEFLKSLANIKSLLRDPSSILWFDYVTGHLMEMERPEVVSFLSSMQRLGEPFINPIADLEDFLGPEWQIVDNAMAKDFVNSSDPLYDEYRFGVVRSTLTGTIDDGVGLATYGNSELSHLVGSVRGPAS